MKNKKIIFSLIISLVFVLANITIAMAATCGKDTGKLCFIPAIAIPGFSEVRKTIAIDGSSLAQYIVKIYRYGAMFAGVVAMFMLVYAGWQWLLAGGNSGKISQARDKINGALIGLALLFGGYILLSLISVNLIQFKPLDTTLDNIPCTLFSTETSCPSSRCNWTPDIIITPDTNEAACIDKVAPIDLLPGYNTCSDQATEQLCKNASLCQWESSVQKCIDSSSVSCSLSSEQVVTKPVGLECCTRMQTSEPDSVIAEFRYAILPFGKTCSHICGNGVWRLQDRSICESNLGY